MEATPKKNPEWSKAIWSWLLGNIIGSLLFFINFDAFQAIDRYNIESLGWLFVVLVLVFTSPLILLMKWIFYESGRRASNLYSFLTLVILATTTMNMLLIYFISLKIDKGFQVVIYVAWPYVVSSLLAVLLLSWRFQPGEQSQ